MKTYYKARGYVYGNLWGGGRGAYPAKTLEANSLKEILEKAEKYLEDGSLDSGMGYESLIGAVLEVETIETMIKNHKRYSNSSFDLHFIGNLTIKENKFLTDCLYRA